MFNNTLNSIIDFLSRRVTYKKLFLKGSKFLDFKDYQYNSLDNLYVKGHEIIFNNEFSILGSAHIITDFSNLESILSKEEQKSIHSFDWLVELKAVGTIESREKAVFLLNSWLDTFEVLGKNNFNLIWNIETIARRLYNLSICYVFLNLTDDLKEKMILHYSRQYEHLLKICKAYRLTNKVKIYKALIVGATYCSKYEGNLNNLVSLLIDNLKVNLLHDGGHTSRNPEEALNVLEDLIIVYNFLKINNVIGINSIKETIYKIDPFIRTMRHSDGTLAVFNGSTESSRYKINLILLLSCTISNPFNNLKNSNYISLKTKTSTAIIDTGENIKDYQSLMAFEVSVNDGKIISNLGNHNAMRPNVKLGQINNSSLILKDTYNNIISLPSDNRTHTSLRTEDVWKKFEVSYLGLKEKYGLTYHHTMYLSQGDEVYILGEHLLNFTGSRKNIKEAYIRVHLHPQIDAIELYSGAKKLLFPLKNNKYFFNSQDGKIRLSKSFYHGRDFYGERCYSLDIPFNLESSAVKIEWSILSINSLAKLKDKSELKDGR